MHLFCLWKVPIYSYLFDFSLHCFDLVILVLPYHIWKYGCKNDILEEKTSPNNYIENLFKLVWLQNTLHSDVVEMYGVIFGASIIFVFIYYYSIY